MTPTSRKIFASIVDEHRPDQGMLLDGFYNDGMLRKAVCHDYAEMSGRLERTGHVDTEYYFLRGHLVFAYRISRQYQRRVPLGMAPEGITPEKIIEDRFYFDHGKLVRWIGANGEEIDPALSDFSVSQTQMLRKAEQTKSALDKAFQTVSRLDPEKLYVAWRVARSGVGPYGQPQCPVSLLLYGTLEKDIPLGSFEGCPPGIKNELAIGCYYAGGGDNLEAQKAKSGSSMVVLRNEFGESSDQTEPIDNPAKIIQRIVIPSTIKEIEPFPSE